MIIKTKNEQEKLILAGKRLREVLDAVKEKIKVGVNPKDLDKLAHDMIIEGGDKPSFLNYKPSGMKTAFPSTLCFSINEQMVHGIPGETYKEVKDGDIVTIDCGLIKDGYFVDSAVTVIVGNGDEKAKKLVEATRKALQYALVFARAGNTTGDIGSAVESTANEYGFTIPPELGGHGVGAAVHEEPFIPNIGDPGKGEKLVEGQVIAIEPIFTEGNVPTIKLGKDNFAYVAEDEARSAHFEHTIIVTNKAPIIVTGPMW